jgi:hypothetical protein
MMADAYTQAAEKAQARLVHTRQALLAQMRRHAPPQRESGAQADGQGSQDSLWAVLRRWWQDHPASGVLELVAPALQGYTRAYPGRTLTLAAGLGAALVLLRPWRLLPLTALALTTARSMPVTELLAVWLAQAKRTKQAAQDRPGAATE